MIPLRKRWLVLHALVFILTIMTSCTWFRKGEDTETPEVKVATRIATDLPEPSATPVPTNLVQIQDDGSSLPPQIISMFPSGGQEIGARGVIRIQFDQSMDQNSTSAAWQLTGPGVSLIPGEITWSGPDTMLFSPSESLEPGTIYQGILEKQAVSTSGFSIEEEKKFEIKVAGELMVSQVFPANGSLEVESNAVLTVIFNRPVVPLMTVKDQVDLIQPLEITPQISGHGEWLNTAVYVFHPSEALSSSTEYTVKVVEGLVDTIGSELKESYDWNFTTSAPSVGSFGIWKPNRIHNPENNLEDVHLDASFSIEFLQPMDAGSVERELSIFSQGGENVPVATKWRSETQLIITPTRQLSLDTDFTLLLTQNTRAATGGTLNEGLRWNFRTLPYPGIERTSPENGTTQTRFSTRVGIYFESPMDLESIEDRIIFQPTLTDGATWHYNAYGWNINYYGLEPSTDYVVRVMPGMEDIYGNQITREFVFNFRTADRNPAAYLDLPYAPSIYTLGGEDRFVVSYVNVSSVDVNLYRIPASYFVGFNNGIYNRWEFEPPQDWLVNFWYWENTKGINVVTTHGLHLTDSTGNMLEPGFYFLTINSPTLSTQRPHHDNRLLVVAEANLTFKTTTDEGLMWLTDLVSGEPMAGIPMIVYDDKFSQVGAGTTDSDGLLYLELPIPEELYRSRYVMTEDGNPFAFAISDWGSGVSPYEFGIWSSFYTLPEQPTAYVYTDRPLYRPGQKASFKGILRQNDDLDYNMLPWKLVKVTINSFNETVYEEVLPISDFGTFNGEFQIDENAALGYYSIQVSELLGDESIGGVGFSVGDYRKPEFQVDVNVDPSDVLAGDEFKIDVYAEYFSGGGVAEADVTWGLQAVDYNFNPGGEFSRYTFVDFDRDTDYYAFYEAPRREIVANGEEQTDSKGRLSLTIEADLSESGSSRQFTFEASVEDIAGTLVSDRVDVIAHKAAVYPGVKSQRYVGKVGEEQAFDLIVLDWNEETVPGAVVDVEIVERRWYSVQEVDSQGYVHWTSTVEEIPAAKYIDVVMNAEGHSIVSFTPEKGGVYKAKVTAVDEFGNEAFSGAYMWVSSSQHVSWRQTDDRRLELVSDKDQYQPGDTAEVLIASPFTGDNYALVTVERGHVRDYEVIRLASNSAVYRLPITVDMSPNVYVSVLVIQGSNEGGKPDFRMGIVQLDVSTDEREVSVEITPDVEEAGPGDTVTYSIQTLDHNGEPVRAEVSLALADLAALNLTGPNTLPILDFFYEQRSLSVRTAVPIVLNIENYISTLEDLLSEGEGMGSGGGKGADSFGVFDIRGDFRDTAFWQAQVVTDENGTASVTVMLPDNLTIWRMDARAVTLDTLVGDSEEDLRSTKPLLLRPQTPRFFVVGDQTVLGAAVHNNTEEDLTVEVALDGSGISLKGTAVQRVDIDAGAQTYVTWEVTISTDVDRVDLIFMAKGGRYTDASRPTIGTLDDQGIPVYKYEVPETVGTSGVLMEPGTRTEGISILPEWDVTAGDLKVKISPSLAAGMTDGLDFLEHFPYECVEQTISRFLPNVLTLRALNVADLSDPELETELKEQVNTALQRLYNWQRPDGGWGWWAESHQSDSLTSAYVLMGMIEAEKSGYHLNTDTRTRGLNYLKASLQSLGSLDSQYLLNRQTFILYVLARAGEPQVSITGAMFDIRQSLSLYAKAYLVETMWMIDPGDLRVDTILSDLNNAAIISATGVYWDEEWRDYWNWNTDTRTTAIILGSIIKIDPENQLNANAVRWLMSNRTNGRWKTTQETAWTLIAFTEWLNATGELSADYDWAVGLNGFRLGDGSVDRDNIKETQELGTDISKLFMDEVNRLSIARDQGPGSLYYTAHLNVYLPVDQVEPLERGIMISRDYFDPDDKENSVDKASQGDILLARLTIVVPNDLHYVVIDDPLPAGLEAVDQSLEISPDITAPEAYDYDSMWEDGWGWWYFDHIELRDERVVISADYLPAGTYVYTYLVRASTPGIYFSIPPTAQEFYFPEVYGRGAGGIFTVIP